MNNNIVKDIKFLQNYILYTKMRVKIFLIVFTLLCVVQSAKWDYWHQKICAQSPAIELDHDVFYSMKSDQGWVGNCIVFSTDN